MSCFVQPAVETPNIKIWDKIKQTVLTFEELNSENDILAQGLNYEVMFLLIYIISALLSGRKIFKDCIFNL